VAVASGRLECQPCPKRQSVYQVYQHVPKYCLENETIRVKHMDSKDGLQSIPIPSDEAMCH
jgi:hypothetical protein